MAGSYAQVMAIGRVRSNNWERLMHRGAINAQELRFLQIIRIALSAETFLRG